jgi:hypothetical protein
MRPFVDIEAPDRNYLVVTVKSPVGENLSELTRTLTKLACQEIQADCADVSPSSNGVGNGRVYRLRLDVDLKSEHLLDIVSSLAKQFRAFGWDVRVA